MYEDQLLKAFERLEKKLDRISDHLNTSNERVARLEQRADSSEQSIFSQAVNVKALQPILALSTTVADHEDRLRGLESFKWKLIGVGVAGGGTGGILAALFTKAILGGV